MLLLSSLFVFIAVLGYIVSAVTLMFVFKKAGIDQWKAWIPVYQFWPFLELGGLHGAWSLLALGTVVPFVGSIAPAALVVLLAVAAYRIGRCFEKVSGWWTVLFVVAHPIWCAIVGLDHVPYDASKKYVKQTPQP